MKCKDIIKWTLVAGCFSLSTTSCSDWLEVDMEDSILENTLFSTNQGYLTSLNGIYSSLNSATVYGGAMSMHFVDVLAQYYNVSTYDHNLQYYVSFNFGDPNFKSTTTAIWTDMYAWIANANLLLENCDRPGAPLLPRYYPLVKGEALALRAMMHFDLLRLFGPIYSAETASTVCMPYQETTVKQVQPMLTAEEVLTKVIRDLEAAADLLKDDPVITEGVKDNQVSNDGLDSFDFSYRQLRLNYYAVKTLLARAYMWKGDKATAYKIAKEDIIDKIKTEKLDVFPWMSKGDVQATVSNGVQDYLFSDEVFFGLYNMKRKTLYDAYFSPSVAADNRLYFYGASMDNSKLNVFYDDDNDVRRSMWSLREGENSQDKSIVLGKYDDFTATVQVDTLTYRYMIPLIRKSEVYLMAAECTSDLAEAKDYINAIRNQRGCASVELTADNRQDLITKEFAREVIGEGQLFFYYKRLGLASFMAGTEPYWGDPIFNMTLSNYVMPLPDVENDSRE